MGLVIATESFTCGTPDGMQYAVASGQTFSDSHPVYIGREHLFRPAEELATGGRVPPADPLTRVSRESGPVVASETADATPGRPRARTTPRTAGK